MNNKTKLIGVVVVLALLVIAFISFGGGGKQEVSMLDTTDTVRAFYDQWLEAARVSAAGPYEAGLADYPYLSKALRVRLNDAGQSGEGVDPVLCQTTVPAEIVTRNASALEDEVQVLVTSKDKKSTEQALVTLRRHNDGWFIYDISCSAGEFEPEREFTFEREGFLLKGSIPPPFSSKNWHLVFEENGEAGHVVPLFFDSKSQCKGLDGEGSVCSPDKLTEVSKVFIRGQMSESGVAVVELRLVK